MKAALTRLVGACERRGKTNDCPILDSLEVAETTTHEGGRGLYCLRRLERGSRAVRRQASVFRPLRGQSALPICELLRFA